VTALSFDELPRLVSLKQAANYLGLTESQVRNLVERFQSLNHIAARITIRTY